MKTEMYEKSAMISLLRDVFLFAQLVWFPGE